MTGRNFIDPIFITTYAQEVQSAVAHFDHIEVTHAGQAFRLGRYPIHFHMEGNVNESYVVGCSVHRSFNRAITIHGTERLRVERNVVYDIMGESG